MYQHVCFLPFGLHNIAQVHKHHFATYVPPRDVSQTSALFSAAKKAEIHQWNTNTNVLAVEDERSKVSKAGFFMLCALGTADVSRVRLCSSLDAVARVGSRRAGLAYASPGWWLVVTKASIPARGLSGSWRTTTTPYCATQ